MNGGASKTKRCRGERDGGGTVVVVVVVMDEDEGAVDEESVHIHERTGFQR